MAKLTSRRPGNGGEAFKTHQTSTAVRPGSGPRLPTSLRFPLDTENASTFIKFTVVKHTKIVSGVTDQGHKEMDRVKMAAQTATQGPAGQTEGDLGASGKEAIGFVGGYIADWLGAGLSAIIPAAASKAFEAASNNVRHENKLTETLGDNVTIFMPQSIQINDSATYDNTALGGAGRMIGAMTASNQLPGMNEALGAAGRAVGNFAQLVKGADPSKMSSSQLASVANKIPGGSEYRAAASHGFGVTLDPVNITTFTGVPIRQFSFTYKFIPNNQQEANAIRNIVKLFRTELYPEKSGWALKYPNSFTIEQIHIPSNGSQRDIVLNKFLKSFLVSVSTTYNPTSMAMMADGSWSEVDLTLTFQEERSMHKNDVMNEDR